MPPVNQGSRAGLITAVVAFAVLFVTSTIFAIYYGVKADDVTKKYDSFRSSVVPEVIAGGDLTGGTVASLRQVRDAAEPPINKGMSLLDVAVTERNEMVNTVTGDPSMPAAKAKAASDKVLTDVAKQTGLGLQTSGHLLSNISMLAQALVGAKAQVATLQGQLEDANNKLASAATETQELLAAKDKEIEQIRADADKQIADAAEAREGAQKMVATIESQQADERKKVSDASNTLVVDKASLQSRFNELQTQFDKLRARLERNRINVGEPLLRQADGKIMSANRNNTVYIDLGTGDQVVPGLTFEVYDRNEGMPRATEGAGMLGDELPKGKASIEVVHVASHTSECRVVTIQPGAVLADGDIIANVVYDKNVHYKFVVYGKFDLDQNTLPTEADADIIRRLITGWGGTLVPKVTVETDFVVLGSEPKVPEYTAEELQEADNNAKFVEAQKQLEAYQDVVSQAQALHIPILNQNRFLYFVGYYDQAQK